MYGGAKELKNRLTQYLRRLPRISLEAIPSPRQARFHSGKSLRVIGTTMGLGGSEQPHAIEFDSQELLIADPYNDRIQIPTKVEKISWRVLV